jgi:hypothetical protein
MLKSMYGEEHVWLSIIYFYRFVIRKTKKLGNVSIDHNITILARVRSHSFVHFWDRKIGVETTLAFLCNLGQDELRSRCETSRHVFLSVVMCAAYSSTRTPVIIQTDGHGTLHHFLVMNPNAQLLPAISRKICISQDVLPYAISEVLMAARMRLLVVWWKLFEISEERTASIFRA